MGTATATSKHGGTEQREAASWLRSCSSVTWFQIGPLGWYGWLNDPPKHANNLVHGPASKKDFTDMIRLGILRWQVSLDHPGGPLKQSQASLSERERPDYRRGRRCEGRERREDTVLLVVKTEGAMSHRTQLWKLERAREWVSPGASRGGTAPPWVRPRKPISILPTSRTVRK